MLEYIVGFYHLINVKLKTDIMIRKLPISFLFLLFIVFNLNSQKLLWTSENGGENQNGAIVSYDFSNQQVNVEASLGGNFLSTFEILMSGDFTNDRYWNTDGMVKGSDGYYYATSAFINDRLGSPTGGFFRINPSDNSLELLHTFSSNCPIIF